ncbi:MAG: hypothetical protein ACRCYW_12920, partial [Aeromonas sp.]|uniref:hypothetical protein n=1 Tax=Aeromonas sp. TaxID=647 RepID=UPI003F2CA4A6
SSERASLLVGIRHLADILSIYRLFIRQLHRKTTFTQSNKPPSAPPITYLLALLRSKLPDHWAIALPHRPTSTVCIEGGYALHDHHDCSKWVWPIRLSALSKTGVVR